MVIERIQAATEVFSYKWYPVIIYTVYEMNGASYSELDSTLDDISSKMLAGGLSDLRERDILEQRETVEGSGRTIYTLSSRGRALVPAIEVLDAWSQRYEGGRSSVLILEDERWVADILAGYFPDGTDVRHVRTGTEAIEAYTDDTDLVIIDRKLEGMPGDDVATRIRTEHEQQLLLCVSGVAPGNDISELEYDDYIHKPVSEDEMMTRVELLLNRSSLDANVRAYLSLRSKQLALTDTHGEAATKMDGYKTLTERIEETDLPTDKKRTLEPLLPAAASESSPFGK